jgi:hypothetical protein
MEKFNLVLEKNLTWEERPYALVPLESACIHICSTPKMDWPRKMAAIRNYEHHKRFAFFGFIARLVGVSLEQVEFSDLGGDLIDGNIYYGYWQHKNYVESSALSIGPEILTSLEGIQKIENVEVFEKFVAIHLRRGDYFNLKNTFGVLSFEYYERALNKVAMPDLPIIIFSDDLDEARALGVRIGAHSVLGPEQANPWQVIKYLSKAGVVITANSSLSWWGGWLNAFNGGITFMPSPWFRDGRVPEKSLQINNSILVQSVWER